MECNGEWVGSKKGEAELVRERVWDKAIPCAHDGQVVLTYTHRVRPLVALHVLLERAALILGEVRHRYGADE